MPGFKDNLTLKGQELGPAPSWSELGGDLVSENMHHTPRTAGLGMLVGGGLGAGAGLMAGKPGHGAMIGGGIGTGAPIGAALGSSALQVLARLGGPMMKLSPHQTHALMHSADHAGTIGGGLLGAAAGGTAGHLMARKAEDIRKEAADTALNPILHGPEAYIGKSMAAAGEGHKNVLQHAGLAGLAGGGLGYALGDPIGGAGGGAGFALGRAGGNILGAGLGAGAGLLMGRYAGVPKGSLQPMMDQWARGGGRVGDVLGGVYGGIKGIGVARRVAHREGYEDEPRKAASVKSAAGIGTQLIDDIGHLMKHPKVQAAPREMRALKGHLANANASRDLYKSQGNYQGGSGLGFSQDRRGINHIAQRLGILDEPGTRTRLLRPGATGSGNTGIVGRDNDPWSLAHLMDPDPVGLSKPQGGKGFLSKLPEPEDPTTSSIRKPVTSLSAGQGPKTSMTPPNTPPLSPPGKTGLGGPASPNATTSVGGGPGPLITPPKPPTATPSSPAPVMPLTNPTAVTPAGGPAASPSSPVKPVTLAPATGLGGGSTGGGTTSGPAAGPVAGGATAAAATGGATPADPAAATKGPDFLADKAPDPNAKPWGGVRGEFRNALGGLGMLGAGAGLGMLGTSLMSSTGVDKYHRNRATEMGLGERMQKNDFLDKQNKVELERQNEIMNRLRNPNAYTAGGAITGF